MLSPRDRLLAEMLVSQRRVTNQTIAQVIAALHRAPGNTLADELVKRGVVDLEVLQSAFEGVKKHGARCVTCGRPFIRRRPGQIMCRRCRRTKSSVALNPWETGASLPPVKAVSSEAGRKRKSSRHHPTIPGAVPDSLAAAQVTALPPRSSARVAPPPASARATAPASARRVPAPPSSTTRRRRSSRRDLPAIPASGPPPLPPPSGQVRRQSSGRVQAHAVEEAPPSSRAAPSGRRRRPSGERARRPSGEKVRRPSGEVRRPSSGRAEKPPSSGKAAPVAKPPSSGRVKAERPASSGKVKAVPPRPKSSRGRKKNDKRPVAPEVEHFGAYEIIEELGRGAMGVVFKAQHTSLSRIVALKVLSAGEKATPRQIQRFRRETEALARLKHPNIVSIYEVGAEQGYPYYTMDLVHGESLEALLGRGELTDEKMADILEQISIGIDYVHAHGFIHRDLKPANVLVDETGRARITDFGLAANQFSAMQLTMSGMSVGTPLYMSPEQSRAEREKTDGRADIWALGVILYRYMTGRLPFTGKNPVEIYEKINRLTPEAPTSVKEGADAQLEMICLKCLEKEPGKRYLRARFLADDLRRYKKGLPLRSVEKAASMGLRDRPWLMIALVAASLFLLTAIGLAIFGPRRDPAPDPDSGNVAISDSPVEGLLAEARAALDAKATTRALTLLREARTELEKDPDAVGGAAARAALSSELFLASARAYLQRAATGDRETAIVELDKALGVQPENLVALRMLAELKEGEEAAELWGRIVDLDGEDLAALHWLADWSVSARQWDEALGHLDSLISLGGDAESFEQRGFVQLHLDRPEEAASDFQLALAHDSGRARAYLGRALARAAQGEGALAELDFVKAAGFDELRAEATRGRARLLLDQRRYAAAADVCQSAPQEMQRASGLDLLAGQALLLQGELDAAEAALQRAAERAEDVREARMWSARLAIVRGEAAAARATLDALLDADPELVEARLLRAQLALDPLGPGPEDFAPVREDLLEVAQQENDAARPRLLLGLLAVAEESFSEAGDRMTEAIARAPYFATSYELQGLLDLHASIERMARSNFDKAKRLYSSPPRFSADLDRDGFARREVLVQLALGENGESRALARAYALCLARIRLEVGSADDFATLGRIEFARGDDEAALRAFALARARNPHLARAAVGEARIRAEAGALDEAIGLYEEALEHEPEQLAWILELAATQLSANRPDDALHSLERHSDIAALDDAGLALRQACGDALGRPSLAREAAEMREALAARAEEAAEWVAKAQAAREQREALLAYQQALNLQPGLATAALEIGAIHAALGDAENAALSLARAVLADSRWTSRLFRFAIELDEAAEQKLWATLSEREPRTPGEALRRDVCLGALAVAGAGAFPERLGPGREAIERVIEARPTLALGWCLRGELRVALALYGAASDDLELAARLDPELAEVSYARALLEAARGDQESSMHHLERALDLGFEHRARIADDPRFADLHGSEGWVAVLARLVDPE